MFDLTEKELRILKKLKTPAAIQDFLNKIPMNFEKNGDTCMSPRRVLQEKKAHCMEGAMLAAVCLRLQGRKPLVIDLKAAAHDFDHVVAVFQEHQLWGAISKTNHGVLRYREPLYKNIRELVMSYFHEYFLNDGEKTLRSFSHPVDLSRFDKTAWITAKDDVWFIPEYLDEVRHYPIVSASQIKKLRKADPIERKMGKIIEWRK